MRLAIDAREFACSRLTGIARFLSGLVDALSRDGAVEEIILAVRNCDAVPENLKRNKKITLIKLSGSILRSEISLLRLTQSGIDCFISPYPKLPIFGTHCPSIHTVHDVLDLTHTAYRNRCKVYLDKFRLKRALAAADLTWYDSIASRQATENLVGFSGCNSRPRVRYPGLEEQFFANPSEDEDTVLAKYELSRGFILFIGNGMPHKNLGLLLGRSAQIKRKLVFIGVSNRNQTYWRFLYPEADAVWLKYVKDEELPAILRNAFCLAQPSTAEGYGYPPLEAMACGVPAVISDIPVLVETTGGCAVVADPHNSDTWLQAFDRLEDKVMYETQVEKGLKWICPLVGTKGWQQYLIDIKEIVRERQNEKGSNHRYYRAGRQLPGGNIARERLPGPRHYPAGGP